MDQGQLVALQRARQDHIERTLRKRLEDMESSKPDLRAISIFRFEPDVVTISVANIFASSLQGVGSGGSLTSVMEIVAFPIGLMVGAALERVIPIQ